MIIRAMSQPVLISEVVNRLAGSYPTLPPTTVAEVVNESHARFDGAPVREFVPLLVERTARTALNKLSV